jgi:hypothetical protein
VREIKKSYLAIAAGAMLVGASLVPLTTLAQQTATGSSSGPTTTQSKPAGRQAGANGPHGRQAFLSQLATNLGLSEQKVRTAFVETREQLLAQRVAAALNVGSEVVLAELQQGKTLAQIATGHGKSAADLKSALLSEHQTHLNAAVARGRLTQDQAIVRLQLLGQRLDLLLNRKFQ